MNFLRTTRRWIAALVGLALSVHVVAMAYAHIPAANVRTLDGSSGLYVDAILGATTLCSSAASHGDSGDEGASTTGFCPFCHRDVALASAAQAPTWYRILVVLADSSGFSPSGVPTLAEHLRSGGIRGRAPPDPGPGLA